MGKVSAGSLDAFAELYDRFCDRAYRVALAVCRDEARAEDAVQEAFLSVWRSRASYRPKPCTVAAWVLTVVRDRAIDIARRDVAHDVSETVIPQDDGDRLRASLARLPEVQQEVITLAYYGQLSHTEIAAQLGLPSGTVKGRIRLGMQKLRAAIEEPAA